MEQTSFGKIAANREQTWGIAERGLCGWEPKCVGRHDLIV